MRITIIIIQFEYSYEKPSSSYCVMWYIWWGCRRNLTLITLGSERVKTEDPENDTLTVGMSLPRKYMGVPPPPSPPRSEISAKCWLKEASPSVCCSPSQLPPYFSCRLSIGLGGGTGREFPLPSQHLHQHQVHYLCSQGLWINPILWGHAYPSPGLGWGNG